MSVPPDPPGTGWRATPLELATDDRFGGRWTSLRSASREWLWTNEGAAALRRGVRPGDPFVDAGGVEECFPTVRGTPDHGDAWSRPWSEAPGDMVSEVEVPAGRLRRRLTGGGPTIVVEYTITGRPGQPFVHAVHALLDVSVAARIVTGEPDAAVVVDGTAGGRPFAWPVLEGEDLSTFGREDGTAICAVLRGCAGAVVVDGDHALGLAWAAGETSPQLPLGLMVWRNLGGWPVGAPYRSIGIEPMVGTAADVADTAGAARLDASGEAAWTLRLAAWSRHR
ncbi:hypothetical protein Bcav_0944 [Beutenbergia cavernae DSM 12333]|uniref:Aldose 1-epimerase n=1 Tax=Beutenbergia cavernae (strain ATCC BAA-8 / DSM 12333 / CCUG 43141 / JCM 11478 / NBRC 16432 / NCIMB 13614 / HKI 0122) TaxID=471853 RepID=C5BZN3_BEUC1|nr:hypothetical protein [Beutenbergia cavernae]ACQ79205.1 hypothetical protein Bcav_0944 [Beutenbergia cavernae DSM 12333]